MKSLTLLRHAKAGWDDAGVRDFDRPLTERGRQDAAAVGRHLRDENLAFDHVLASPAMRVAETLAQIAIGYGRSLEAAEDRRLYLAPTGMLLDLVHIAPADATRVLIVGHNPGLAELVSLLSDAAGQGDGGEGFPTAALAEIAFEVESWAAVMPGTGRLMRFVRPRDRDSAAQ